LLPALVDSKPICQLVGFTRIAWDVVVAPKVKGVPKVPLRLQEVVNVLVVRLVNVPLPTAVFVMPLKVFDPVTVKAPAMCHWLT